MDFAIKPTLPINLAGAVSIAGTVPVVGDVGINGNVPVIGSLTSQTVASGATGTVVSDATNGANVPLTTTILSSGARTLELHSCLYNVIIAGPNPGGPARLLRSDTGADIMAPAVSGTLPAGRYSASKDFEGARIPPSVSIQSVLSTTGFGNTIEGIVDLNYNVIG